MSSVPSTSVRHRITHLALGLVTFVALIALLCGGVGLLAAWPIACAYMVGAGGLVMWSGRARKALVRSARPPDRTLITAIGFMLLALALWWLPLGGQYLVYGARLPAAVWERARYLQLAGGIAWAASWLVLLIGRSCATSVEPDKAEVDIPARNWPHTLLRCALFAGVSTIALFAFLTTLLAGFLVFTGAGEYLFLLAGGVSLAWWNHMAWRFRDSTKPRRLRGYQLIPSIGVMTVGLVLRWPVIFMPIMMYGPREPSPAMLAQFKLMEVWNQWGAALLIVAWLHFGATLWWGKRKLTDTSSC